MFADETFPHNFYLNSEAWLPPCPDVIKVYYYPGADERGGHDGVLVEVTPENGTSWLGMFASWARCGISGVYCCPDGQSVCVVSDGTAYVVRADAPLAWEEIADAVQEVRVLSEHRLMVFRDYTSLTAYGANGFAWRADDIALDGLTIDNIEGNKLRGRAWVDGCETLDYETWEDYEVDLLTGSCQGGLQPDNISSKPSND